MNIGKPVKVTEEPKPVKAPEIKPRRVEPTPKHDPFEPFYVPVRVPARPSEPSKTFPAKEVWDVITTQEVPSQCYKCGRTLKDLDTFNLMLECPKHGVVFKEFA